MIYPDKGYIGCFEMTDKVSGKQRLAEYVRQLQNAGHRRIIAPINGDTWHTYRLVSWDGGFPALPLEPQNPLWYNDVYKDAGFVPLAKYHSALFPIKNIEEIPSQNNVVYKRFEPDDLKVVYDISVRGFDKSFLYAAITYRDFCKLYEPILPMVDSDFVLISYVDGVPCGFMLSIGIGDVFILKTIAVLSEYRKLGIGRALMNKVLLKAQEKGFNTAVGALMIDGNISQDMVSRYGAEKIREYTLYEYC